MLTGLPILIFCGYAAFSTFRLAIADREAHSGLPGGLEHAAALAPGNARYFYRIALDAPEGDTRALAAALKLNPRYSAAWMELGLRSEFAHDYPRAEHAMLEAARVDRTFLPRWTLANYYFRRDDRENFWYWSREAAQISYDDLRALFRLCWNASNDGEEILRHVIPARRDIWRQYLGFLLRHERTDAAATIAGKLLEDPVREDVAPLMAGFDRFAMKNDRLAVAIWNRLASRKLIPNRPLAPEQGVSLSNGDFSLAPTLRGFDWRTNEMPGVSVSLASPPALVVNFSGKQPQNCETAFQWMPLLPARRYELKFAYRTRDVVRGSGLAWTVTDVAAGAPWSVHPIDSPAEDWKEDGFAFTTPGSAGIGQLQLNYRRSLGTTRIEGMLSIRNVRLELLP